MLSERKAKPHVAEQPNFAEVKQAPRQKEEFFGRTGTAEQQLAEVHFDYAYFVSARKGEESAQPERLVKGGELVDVPRRELFLAKVEEARQKVGRHFELGAQDDLRPRQLQQPGALFFDRAQRVQDDHLRALGNSPGELCVAIEAVARCEAQRVPVSPWSVYCG